MSSVFNLYIVLKGHWRCLF